MKDAALSTRMLSRLFTPKWRAVTSDEYLFNGVDWYDFDAFRNHTARVIRQAECSPWITGIGGAVWTPAFCIYAFERFDRSASFNAVFLPLADLQRHFIAVLLSALEEEAVFHIRSSDKGAGILLGTPINLSSWIGLHRLPSQRPQWFH